MPANPARPLFFLLAKATHSAMAQQVEYLKTENEILSKRLPKNLRTTDAERKRLIKVGAPLGTGLKHLITIVTYLTFLRWQRDEEKTIGRRGRPGRPRTQDEIRQIVLRLARENQWGYGRILGELRKLGIRNVCATTVKNILVEHGLDPCPKRSGYTWAEFVKRHAETLWACDFVSRKILTKSGFVDCFVFFYIHVASRHVHVAGVTTCPSGAWMAQQARNLNMYLEDRGGKPIYLIHDRDDKFTEQFKDILKSRDHKLVKLPPRAPRMNAYAERWVQSLSRECLDHFLIFGEDHMRHLVREYTGFYNTVRPHQGKGNRPLGSPLPGPRAFPPGADAVRCRAWLGGLLKHYYSEAA